VKTITVDRCLAFDFHDLAKMGHIMTMATMVMGILSPISSQLG
jgi:hypothetical protein